MSRGRPLLSAAGAGPLSSVRLDSHPCVHRSCPLGVRGPVGLAMSQQVAEDSSLSEAEAHRRGWLGRTCSPCRARTDGARRRPSRRRESVGGGTCSTASSATSSTETHDWTAAVCVAQLWWQFDAAERYDRLSINIGVVLRHINSGVLITRPASRHAYMDGTLHPRSAGAVVMNSDLCHS